MLLGIVEGLTEFLPISSTGHLILTERLIGFEGQRAESFAIFIQLGAILAVVWEHRVRVTEITRELPRSTRARGQVLKLHALYKVLDIVLCLGQQEQQQSRSDHQRNQAPVLDQGQQAQAHSQASHRAPRIGQIEAQDLDYNDNHQGSLGQDGFPGKELGCRQRGDQDEQAAQHVGISGCRDGTLGKIGVVFHIAQDASPGRVADPS